MENPKKSATKSEQANETKAAAARPKLGPIDHVAYVADALIRLQNRLRLAERGVFGPDRMAVNDLRKDVLTVYVKADTVRGALEGK